MVPVSYFDGYDHAIMGHIHSPMVFSKTVQLIGSMDINTFGEIDHQKHIIVLSEDEYFEELIPVRRLNKVCLEVPDDVVDSTKYVLAHLKSIESFDGSITKLDINLANCAGASIDKKVIEKYLESRGVFNLCGFSETKHKEIVRRTNVDVKYDMEISSAVKFYADTKFEDEKVRAQFLTASFELLTEFELSQK
jgi:DNA repair exonuclease SbcCD nuclease subunit